MLIEENFEIKKLTSFKCGGKVKKVIFPECVDDFSKALEENPDAKVFGNLSNTLISTDGYDGVIILTTKLKESIIAMFICFNISLTITKIVHCLQYFFNASLDC